MGSADLDNDSLSDQVLLFRLPASTYEEQWARAVLASGQVSDVDLGRAADTESPGLTNRVDLDRDGGAELLVTVRAGPNTVTLAVLTLHEGRLVDVSPKQSLDSQGIAFGGAARHSSGYRCQVGAGGNPQLVTTFWSADSIEDASPWTWHEVTFAWKDKQLVFVNERSGIKPAGEAEASRHAHSSCNWDVHEPPGLPPPASTRIQAVASLRDGWARRDGDAISVLADVRDGRSRDLLDDLPTIPITPEALVAEPRCALAENVLA
ncbi:MAG: hypothetical protein LC799_15145, partial [Actinobacteria bacterium]|nr:hypothetical protein [Actinomycetota bacterium]